MGQNEPNRELHDLASVIETVEDPREASQRVAERIRQLTAQGENIPTELHKLAHRLQCECIAASQGR